MEKALRRRGITTRQKEGLYRNFGNGRSSDDRERRRSTKNDYYGASEEPEYENMEKSARYELEREGRQKGSSFRSRNSREADRRTHGQRNSNRWYEDEQRYFGRERNNEEREIRPRFRSDHEFENDQNYYGEHPNSMGYEEYRGGNKRHPGLLGSRNRSQYNELYEEHDRDLREENERRYRREREENPTRNHKNDTRLAMRDYLNRRQFDTPFQSRDMYDPIESEYERQRMEEYRGDDHIYKYKGYQHSGNHEGFGKRGGRQQGHDWRDEDEYREGHAQRQRGYGKYGSR